MDKLPASPANVRLIFKKFARGKRSSLSKIKSWITLTQGRIFEEKEKRRG